MGSRGASSGRSDNGKEYGTEFESLYQYGNIKFLKHKEGSATAPLETMTKGRVYVTLNHENKIKYISYYDKNNKRSKTIDVLGPSHNINNKPIIPHTHVGYEHEKTSARELSKREQNMLDNVKQIWQNHIDNR